MTALASCRNYGLQVLGLKGSFGYREIAHQHHGLPTYFVFLETPQLR